MQRDMDLAREILLEMECRGSVEEQSQPISIEGYSNEQVSYHIQLLCDAGYMEGINATSSSGLLWLPKSLTWAGHEFLELSRVDTRWSEAKKIVTEKAGSVGFELIKEVLVSLARSTLGIVNP